MSFIRCFLRGIGLAWGWSCPSYAQQGAPASGEISFELPTSLPALEQASGVGTLVFGRPLPTLLEEVVACHVVKGERVACLAAHYAIALDSLHLTGLTLLSYTGQLYGVYSPPCRVTDTAYLLRWLQQHYGPGQALGKGQLLWQGAHVCVVYEPVVTWQRVGRSRAASIAHVQGVVGVLSTAILAQAQADHVLLRSLK
jgi:hypothetical protein